MAAWPVSERVGNVRNSDAELLEKAQASPGRGSDSGPARNSAAASLPGKLIAGMAHPASLTSLG